MTFAVARYCANVELPMLNELEGMNEAMMMFGFGKTAQVVEITWPVTCLRCRSTYCLCCSNQDTRSRISRRRGHC
jgi:hypothetical protein